MELPYLENKTQIFNEKLGHFKSQFPHVLENFQKYYVFSNKNPDYQEYQTFFNESKQHLQQINNELFLLKNNVQENSEQINNLVKNMNVSMEGQKLKNNNLLEKYNAIVGENNGSQKMFYNSKTNYRILNYQNIIYITGIVILLRMSMLNKVN
jgi:hypothetical protein